MDELHACTRSKLGKGRGKSLNLPLHNRYKVNRTGGNQHILKQYLFYLEVLCMCIDISDLTFFQCMLHVFLKSQNIRKQKHGLTLMTPSSKYFPTITVGKHLANSSTDPYIYINNYTKISIIFRIITRKIYCIPKRTK